RKIHCTPGHAGPHGYRGFAAAAGKVHATGAVLRAGGEELLRADTIWFCYGYVRRRGDSGWRGAASDEVAGGVESAGCGVSRGDRSGASGVLSEEDQWGGGA